MLVLGIDPGTATTGYGVVRSDKPGLATLVECGVIRTRARDPLPARLREIFADELFVRAGQRLVGQALVGQLVRRSRSLAMWVIWISSVPA